VHIGEPSLFRFYELDKINASLITLLFKPFVKKKSPIHPLGDIRVLSPCWSFLKAPAPVAFFMLLKKDETMHHNHLLRCFGMPLEML
jgi:hypothetical protein